jgi:hypothetical protein
MNAALGLRVDFAAAFFGAALAAFAGAFASDFFAAAFLGAALGAALALDFEAAFLVAFAIIMENLRVNKLICLIKFKINYCMTRYFFFTLVNKDRKTSNS